MSIRGLFAMLTSFVLWSISGIQHISRSGGKRKEFWEPSIQWGCTGTSCCTYCCSHCSHEWACQSMTSTGRYGLLQVVCSYVKYFYVFSSRLDILFLFELFLFHTDFWVNCPLNIDWNCELNNLKAFLAHCFFLSLSYFQESVENLMYAAELSFVTQPIDGATPVKADATPVNTEPDKVSRSDSNHMMHALLSLKWSCFVWLCDWVRPLRIQQPFR